MSYNAMWLVWSVRECYCVKHFNCHDTWSYFKYCTSHMAEKQTHAN